MMPIPLHETRKLRFTDVCQLLSVRITVTVEPRSDGLHYITSKVVGVRNRNQELLALIMPDHNPAVRATTREAEEHAVILFADLVGTYTRERILAGDFLETVREAYRMGYAASVRAGQSLRHQPAVTPTDRDGGVLGKTG